jgi:hypothetical protein
VEITRLVELSLFNKIQDKLSRFRSKETPTSANFLTYNLKYNNVQTKYPVTVYVNNIPFNSSFYKVDYTNGIINFNTPLTSSDNVQVDYTYCFVNIYDESMSPTDSNFSYPAVAVYEAERKDEGLELGSNAKEMHPLWVIDVWAERGGERNDYTDMIVSLFEENDSHTIIDYNIAFPVNSDGTMNQSFNEDSQIKGYMYVDSIKYHKGGSLNIGEKPRFLTEILLDLTVII